MWKQPWGSAEGWAICAGLLITGFGLQLITGPVQAGLFQYPVNVAGGLIFLLVLCIGFVVSRKITVVQWFSGLTASITSLSALLSVVLVMGFVGPGIERITMSWPFILLFLYFLFVLGFVTLKRIVSFRWRDVPFMLNHVGLFITLLAAILGNGDLRRLRMTVPLENPEWRASDEKNEMIELPLAIELRSFTIDEYPLKLDELVDVCQEWHIELVEDAAESIGSLYKRRHTGIFGKVGAISFNGNKTITTGGGGMMLFQDEEMGKLAKHITTQAKVPHRWEFRHDHIGYNYRMPNINAALGCAQLEHLDEFVASKRKVAQEYADFFKDIPDIDFFEEPEDSYSNYWLNVVIMKDKAAQYKFLEYTNDHGVMTRPIWELMNRLPMFEKYENDGLENTIWFADRVVNIPSSVRL